MTHSNIKTEEEKSIFVLWDSFEIPECSVGKMQKYLATESWTISTLVQILTLISKKATGHFWHSSNSFRPTQTDCFWEA